MEEILQERQKQRFQDDQKPKSRKQDPKPVEPATSTNNIQALVQSVKQKSANFSKQQKNPQTFEKFSAPPVKKHKTK